MPAIRTAVIGYGFAGRSFHAYLVGLTQGLELYGIASRNSETQEKIRARGDCRVYTSLDEVLADPEIELVVLATPNDVHCEYSVRALEAGKNVVVDKPMCLNLAECDQMIAAAQKTGKLLSVFQNRRWDGDFLTVKQLMSEGKLGDVRWIEMAWQKFGPSGGWRGQSQEKGGGRFYDQGAHLFDQLLQFFPERITGVYCRMQHDFPERDVESTATIIVHFEGERTGICDASSLAALPKPRFLVHGTGGSFIKYEVDPQEEAMKKGDIDAAREDPAHYGRLSDGKNETVIPTLPGRWRSYYENIAGAINGTEQPAVRVEEVRRAIAVFDAARQSAQSEEVVKVDIPSV
jgi:scyllo-inositol 2-dehydrogenase (NADP+)